MATAYTAPTTYKGYEDQWDEELLATALTYKQQKYDVNKAKIQNWFNDFATLDLVKEEDRARFAERIAQVKEQVNRQGMGDLSLGADHIATYISQAADKGIENGYYGTLAGRKIQKEAKDMFDKDPSLYNQRNLDYSLKDWNNWVNDGTAGSTYRGGSSYVPYTDVNQKIIDIFKEHKPDIKVITTKMGVQYINSENQIMTEAQVEDILEGLVYSDPNVAQQLKVDSWATFQGQDNAVISQDMKNSLITKKGKYETALTDIKTKMKTAKGESLAQLQAYEKAYTDQINTLNGDIDNWENQFNKNPDAYKEFAYKSRLTEQMKGIYVKNNVIGITSITDQAALENLKHSNSLAKMREEKTLDKMNEIQKAMLGKIDTVEGIAAFGELMTGINPVTGNPYSYTELADSLQIIEAQVAGGSTSLENIEVPDYISELNNSLIQVENDKNALNNQLQAIGKFIGQDNLVYSGDTEGFSALKDVITQNWDEMSAGEKKQATDFLQAAQSNINQKERLERKKTEAFGSVLEEAKNTGTSKEFGNGMAIAYDNTTGEYLYKNTRTAKEAVSSTAGRGWGGVTSVYRNIRASGELPVLAPLKGDSGLTIKKWVESPAEMLRAEKQKYANHPNRDEIYEYLDNHVKPFIENKNFNTLTPSQGRGIYMRISNIPDVVNRVKQYNTTPTRENKGKWTPISEKDATSLLHNAYITNSIDLDGRRIIENSIASKSFTTDLTASTRLSFTDKNLELLEPTLRTIIGLPIDFSKKETYSLNTDVSADKTIISGYHIQDKEKIPFSETIPASEALKIPIIGTATEKRQEQLQEQDFQNNLKREIEYNSEYNGLSTKVSKVQITSPDGDIYNIETGIKESGITFSGEQLYLAEIKGDNIPDFITNYKDIDLTPTTDPLEALRELNYKLSVLRGIFHSNDFKTKQEDLPIF